MEDIKQLKEAQQKWQALQPLTEDEQARLSRKFTVEFNYNSNHIEGNTLTYGQTEILLLFGKVIAEAEMRDLEEMKASNIGLKMMQVEAGDIHKPLTETFIRTLHHTLLREDYTVYKNLPGGVQTSYTIHAGCYKTRSNSVITRYGDRFEYASPEETPALMNDLVAWYNEAEKSRQYTPMQLAILFHYRYIRIHPFEDGNGRIARLMVNFILARHGLPMLVVRSKEKQNYLEALHKSDMKVGVIPSVGAHAALEDILPFYTYMEKAAALDIETNIMFLRDKAENIWWHNGEKVTFRSPTTPKLLRTLMAEPSITINELTARLGINRSAVQKQLDGLEKKGYILRGTYATDKWYLAITPSV